MRINTFNNKIKTKQPVLIQMCVKKYAYLHFTMLKKDGVDNNNDNLFDFSTDYLLMLFIFS